MQSLKFACQLQDPTNKQLNDESIDPRKKQFHDETSGEATVPFLLAELKRCSTTKNLENGREVHAAAVQSGNDSSIYVVSALVNMYSKCGSMAEAQKVFDSIANPDAVSWNALILGYANNGKGALALDLFAKMRSRSCAPTKVTFLAAIKACTSIALKDDGNVELRELGKEIHSQVGSVSDMSVQNTLMNMYAKFGDMVAAQKMFQDMKETNVVSWNVLMLGYVENGEGAIALELFQRMKSEGCIPSRVTYIAALKASICLAQDECGRIECRDWGKQIHFEIGNQVDIYVKNTLIDLYTKCGCMDEARKIFDSISHPTVVSWTSLILGYADNGQSVNALDLFTRMKSEGCVPDCVAYVAAMKACAQLGALESGRKIHAEIGTRVANVILVTSIVDFYTKCGSMVEAQDVFDLHHGTRDIKTWTALLAGYSCLGDEKSVFELFYKMQDEGFQPNGVTFLCILTCCSYAGLIEKAKTYFEAMTTKYCIQPNIEHYNCMLDILGRYMKLDDAVTLLQAMPWRPTTVTWLTVLGACRMWKNAGIGTLAFRSLVSLDGTNAVAYMLMGHIYRSRGMWAEVDLVLGMRRKSPKAREGPAETCWTTEVGEVHTLLDLTCKHALGTTGCLAAL